jgi:GntR family transcriptional regulator
MLRALPSGVSGKLPLWYQVSQSLRAFVVYRRSEEPTRLPTEAALARHYDVSLATVRQALSGLEAEGPISRHRRRGTFINPRAPGTDPRATDSRSLRVLGSVDTILAQQVSDEVRLLGRTTGAVPASLSDRFPGQAEVTCFRRLRSDAGEPFSYAENFLPISYADRIADTDLAAAPMTMVLRDKLGLKLSRIENSVEAQRTTPHMAKLLGANPADPVLVSTNLTFDADGLVVDAALLHYRSDRFRFSVGVDLS